MDKSGKIYVKAMNKYNDGYIDKALYFCEKSISLNSRNAAALNLKGILYYLKGDLEKAKKMWEINYKRNNDKVSKKYLNDSARDKEYLQLYVNALELIKKLNICGALEILKQCENSHFNFINVNNHISICYIKQGEYDKAQGYINEVLKVDKNNDQAIINKKILVEYGSLKREINYKKIAIITTSILLTTGMLILGKIYMAKGKDLSAIGFSKMQSGISLINKNDQKENKNLVGIESNKLEKVKKEPKNQSDIVNGKKSGESKTQQIQQFPRDGLNKSIKDNNMEQIVLYLNRWKNTEVEMNDKLLMIKGKEIIKSSGVLFFYEKGTSYMNDRNFIQAQKYFIYALPYSYGNYLQEHILYMLALSYKSISDFENAVKYYELILKQYPSGSYTQEVLYNLIIINKDVNMNKAMTYAQRLVKDFPDSQYNNSIVKKMLGI